MCSRQNVRALRRTTRDPRETEGEPLNSGFQRSTGATFRVHVPERGHSQGTPAMEGRGYGSAESALRNCSAVGAGRLRGGAIQRRQVIGCWGGARRRGGAGPASDLRALAGGAARDTWCGTGAVSRRSPCGLSFPGGRCGPGTGWAQNRAVWESPWSAIKCGNPGHPSESGGRSWILMHSQPRPESPQAPARARVLEELSLGPRPPSRKSRF